MAMVDCSEDIVNWARWSVAHKSWFDYQLIRPIQLFEPSATHVIVNDCSGTVCLFFWLGKAPDPMGFNYANPVVGEDEGNSDTLAQRGSPVASAVATKNADVVVYWPSWDTNCSGASEHTALIVQGGVSDPLTVSHGHEGTPEFVTVNQDGRPHRFYRFNTTKPAPVPPKPPQPKEHNVFISTNPNNKGKILVNEWTSQYKGFPDPTVYADYNAVLDEGTLHADSFNRLTQIAWGASGELHDGVFSETEIAAAIAKKRDARL